MSTLETELNSILYLVSCVIEEDNNRNYGDRDIYIHKLKNIWEDFIELHPTSDDPAILGIKNKIKVLE